MFLCNFCFINIFFKTCFYLQICRLFNYLYKIKGQHTSRRHSIKLINISPKDSNNFHRQDNNNNNHNKQLYRPQNGAYWTKTIFCMSILAMNFVLNKDYWGKNKDWTKNARDWNWDLDTFQWRKNYLIKNISAGKENLNLIWKII